MPRSRWLTVPVVAIAGCLLLASGCSSNGSATTSASTSSAPVTSPSAATTVALPTPTVASLPATTAELPVATEVLPPATQVSTTVAATTLPATTAPVTSIAGTPDCRLEVIIEQTETGFDGMKPGGLRCAGPWATWSGTPLDPNASDPYFAVALWRNGSWILGDLGTAGVCEGAGVPAELWPSLDCTE